MSSILDRQLMSLYVTLLLSVACLGYGELGQNLPETPFFYLFMFVALGVAYWAEGKYSLSIFASNALAAVVLLVGLGWLFLKIENTSNEFDAGYNLIRSLVSRTGPILCSLLLAKLFRPKTGSDQWLLQLLGLVQVILASVLAMSSRMDRDAPLFPVLMLLYLCSLAWSFRLFYLRHEMELMPLASKPADPSPVQWFSLKPVGWFLLCFLIAVVIFFCLPQGGLDASLFQGVDHYESGNTSNIDLNAEGTVQVSDEKVMCIWAKNKDGPVVLPDSLRLRGAILSHFDKNVWHPFPSSAIMPQQLPVKPGPLGDNVIRMDYEIDVARIQELGKPKHSRYSSDYNIPLFLADPPVTSRYLSQFFSMPAVGNIRTPLNANVFEGQTWLSLSRKTQSISITHDYTGKLNANEWQQTFREMPADSFQYLRLLSRVPSSIAQSGKVLALTNEILNTLVASKVGPNATERDKSVAMASLTDREKALALEKHLSSKEYSYSLDRRKQDISIDPTEDFLFNVKEGHCERYASALALMLRTAGIKSRIIIGYRGLEWNAIGGFYLVRQLHAHAWVEALIGNDHIEGGSQRLTWLVLDATPLNEVRSTESTFTSPLTFARFLWEFFILDFAGQAQRSKLLAQLQHTWLGKLIDWYSALNVWQATLVAIGFVLFIVAVIWLILRWRRKVRERKYAQKNFTVVTVPFYSRLLKILASKGWKPTPSQTPSEFTTAVQQQLQKDPQNAGIAEIPAALVPPYYAVRFGGTTLTQQQQSQVDQQLQTLQQSF